PHRDPLARLRRARSPRRAGRLPAPRAPLRQDLRPAPAMTDKNRNLAVRLLTAFLLLPLIIWLIWLGGVWFALLIATATGMCALELNLLPANLPRDEPEEEDGDKLSRKQRKKKRSAVQEEIEEIELES